MSHLVLARKWRPKTFEELVGQETVSITLKNAIESNKLSHALIFSGPRGVGKTSTARIVAKALNCLKENPKERPCSDNAECSICKEISEGKSFDVQEIDAASHTGVNDIREIIENATYLPTRARKKVYIIDEAHMLSQAAFNALLKTLEEPPPHVQFILATTEIHKIPATIQSRCQRYDFRKIPVAKIKEALEQIANTEEIEIEEKTLYLIAREGDGSLRDSLSLLDQLIATFGNKIVHEEAVSILGLLDRSNVKIILKNILERDPKGCVEHVLKALKLGINPKKFIEEITRIIRALVVMKACGKEAIYDMSEDEKKELLELAKSESIESLELLFKLSLEGADLVQRSYYPEMALEASILKLCIAERFIPIDSVLDKLKEFEKSISTKKDTYSEDTTQKTWNNIQPSTEKKTLEDSKNKYSDFDKEEFISNLKKKHTLVAMHLENASSIEKKGKTIAVTFANNSIHYEYLTKTKILKALSDYTKKVYGCEISIELKEPTQDKQEERSEKENKDPLGSDPVIRQAIEMFDGRIVNRQYKKRG